MISWGMLSACGRKCIKKMMPVEPVRTSLDSLDCTAVVVWLFWKKNSNHDTKKRFGKKNTQDKKETNNSIIVLLYSVVSIVYNSRRSWKMDVSFSNFPTINKRLEIGNWSHKIVNLPPLWKDDISGDNEHTVVLVRNFNRERLHTKMAFYIIAL